MDRTEAAKTKTIKLNSPGDICKRCEGRNSTSVQCEYAIVDDDHGINYFSCSNSLCLVDTIGIAARQHKGLEDKDYEA